jgi:predicted ATPase
LAPVRDPDLVVPTIAEALGLQNMGSRSLTERLIAFLRRRQMLLVLDNVEQLLEAVPHLATLLTACPHIKILVTSRAVLHLSSEQDFPVPLLTLPRQGAQLALEEVAAADAVQLFVARARAAHPDFALTDTNASAVSAICQRLEGLPLAVELAAAQIAHLPLRALLRRLEQCLPLLTGGPRDVPARLQTMRDAIAWSYELLSPEAQALFRHLAIFVGGFTVEAAAAIVAAEGDQDGNVLEGIAALIDQSLVQRLEGPGGEPRYQMLETVREFGLEQLVASGEYDTLARRHADYCLTLAQSGAAALASAKQGDWLARLEADQANLRAALSWLRDDNATEIGLRLATALGGFWHVRSANAEGREWLETFLARSTTEASVTDRIIALRWAGELAGLQGDFTVAEAHLHESLTLAHQEGDKRGIAAAVRAIGSAKIQIGDVAGGIAPLAEAAVITRELGDKRQTAFLLAYLACAVAQQGDQPRAESLVAEAEVLVRALGVAPSFELDFVEFVQGWVAITQGKYDRAQPRLEAAVAMGRTIAAKGTLSAALAGLGEVALARGDVVTAAEQYREGLILGWEGQFPLGIAFNLQGLVRVGSRSSELVPVARVIGVLDGFSGAAHALPGAAFAAYQAAVARVRAVLGDAAFAAALAAGRTLPLDEAIAEAVGLLNTPRVPAIAATETSAAGSSDQVIADALFLSRRTVNTHVSQMLTKLGVPTRAAAVAVAVRHGLA